MDIEGALQESVELLKGLIEIPSLSRQEDKAADFLQARLDVWFKGCVLRQGNSLIVDLKGDAPGPTLMACSHIDTVQVADGWTRDPFKATVEGDRIYGLGANDAGASVVTLALAAKLMGKPKAGRLLLCFVAEEEEGSNGFVKLEPELPAYDAGLFGEPTEMGMATAMRGAMRAVVRSRGKSCHASRPWEGKNACDKLIEDLTKLRALDLKDGSVWKQTTIEPTIIQGGASPNQIPALIETTLDIRTAPGKDNDWVLDALEKTGIEYEVTFNRRRPMQNAPDAPLVQAVRKAHPDVKDYVFNGTCDMAFARAPSIVMGPGKSERSHAADEFICVSEMKPAIELYAAVFACYLSAQA